MSALPVLAHPPREEAALCAHTIWGLDAVELHARLWASRGVQVVRPGEPSPLAEHAELYLLLDRDTLALFSVREIARQIAWIGSDVTFVRVQSEGDGYREQVIADTDGRFLRFARMYDGGCAGLRHVALTPDRVLAEAWQTSPGAGEGRRRIRRLVARSRRWTCSIDGEVFDRSSPEDAERCVRRLMATWARPDAVIDDLRMVRKGVFAHVSADVSPKARFVGRAWVGAGRTVNDDDVVVGAAALWDEPESRPAPEAIRWLDLEPVRPPNRPKARVIPAVERGVKRAFDIAFALAALAVTLPLYPFIMLAILIEDGRPFFFAHRRETLGGRPFPCLKFRSMRKDAEKIKADLAKENQADGPQFFIERDPRLTRVGAFLRATQLDELPQFLNVLVGHMSVVGPRPSPATENQYCPGWREARLSVRPGVTGLWQINRTRAPGTDFQEWIRYDIEYVERAGLLLDMIIIYKTIVKIVHGVIRS